MVLLSALEQAVVAVVRAYRSGYGYGPTHVEIANATKAHPSQVDQSVEVLLERRVIERDALGLDVPTPLQGASAGGARGVEAPSVDAEPVDAPPLGSIWANDAGLGGLAAGGGGQVVVTQVTDSAWGRRCVAVSLDGVGSLSGRVVDVLGGRVCVGHVSQAFLSKDLRHVRGSAAHDLRANVLAAAQWRSTEGRGPQPDGAG